jgi:hypothetical protein
VNSRATPPDPPICEVLAAWRSAERELGVLGDEDPMRDLLQEIVGELRLLHGRLFDERRARLESDEPKAEGAAVIRATGRGPGDLGHGRTFALQMRLAASGDGGSTGSLDRPTTVVAGRRE